MAIINEMRVDFLACPENEAFARMVISAFVLPLNPTLEQLGDIKTSVSEAVTNAIIHGYRNEPGTVRMKAQLNDVGELVVDIIDNGCGIADVGAARTPFFSSVDGTDRSGMGFTVMESFMDEVMVFSEVDLGTTVRMRKLIQKEEAPLVRHA